MVKAISIILLGITILLLSFEFYTGYADVSGYSFELIEVSQTIKEYIHADFDGDGQDEIILNNVNRREYAGLDIEGEGFPWRFHSQEDYLITEISAFDVNNDGKVDIIQAEKDLYGDSVWCRVKNWDRDILCQTEAIKGKNLNDETNEYPSWDGSLGDCAVYDLDGDGRNELIISLNTGQDERPRGIYVYSYPDGKLKWHYLTAGGPGCLNVTDIDNDGFGDIFFGTHACSNGVEEGAMRDDISYVARLSWEGKLVWQMETGQYFTHGWLLLTDMEDDGIQEMYSKKIEGNLESEESVSIFGKSDPATGQFTKRHIMKTPENVKLLSGKISAKDEQYLITTVGIDILDKDMNPVRTKNLPGHKVFSTADLDGDGIDEILTFKKDTVFILDTLLNTICAYKSEKNKEIFGAFLFHASPDSYLGKLNSKFLYLHDARVFTESINCVRLLLHYNELSVSDRLTAAARNYRWYTIALFLMFGFLSGWIIFQYNQKHMPQIETTEVPAVYTNLLTTLTTFNHGQTASNNLNRLAFLLKNVPGSDDIIEQFSENLTESINTFNNFTLRHLKDIVTQLKKAGNNIPQSNNIEKMTVNLETSFLNADLANPLYLKNNCDSLKETFPPLIEDLRREIREVRSRVRRHFRTNVVRETVKVMDSVKPDFIRKEINLSAADIRGDITTFAFFSPLEFLNVMEELLSNARIAMENSPEKALKLKIDLFEQIEIRVIDTGHGVEPDKFNQIFQRGFSTKPGSNGYGLQYVFDTISRYDGNIRIEKSEPDKETIFLITLQRV